MGIGELTGLRCNNQAIESWATVAPCCFASGSSLPPGWASFPAATGYQENEILLTKRATFRVLRDPLLTK
jgi:hypothetical protein